MKIRTFFSKHAAGEKIRIPGFLAAAAVLACTLALPGCGNPVSYKSYAVVLPEIPAEWEAVLGKAIWYIEWVDPDGHWQYRDKQESRIFRLEICNTLANPVLAFPYWPGKHISPGIFPPAGALFPLDASGDTLTADWYKGVDARFFTLLSALGGEGSKHAELFDWRRFRSLFRDRLLPEDVMEDPWIVDWDDVAGKTIRSGFDKRRLVSRPFTDMTITVPEEGFWITTSPFAPGRYWEKGTEQTVKTSPSGDRYFSEQGTIILNDKTWAYFPQQ